MKKSKFIKIGTWIILSIFIIASILYYGNFYLRNYELSFTVEHKFILFAFAICILIVVALSTLILYRNFKLEKILRMILVDISDSEDNIIEVNRTTQNMIMKLSGSLGVDKHDKRL